MSIEELQTAVSQLSPEELGRFSEWFQEFLADQWDRQIEDDILAGAPTETVDVLRAANILNKGYFDEDILEQMVRNLRRRLRPGGLMIVCNTDYNEGFDYGRMDYGGMNNASLFRLDADGRFVVQARLNAGSEIEGLVLRTRA